MSSNSSQLMRRIRSLGTGRKRSTRPSTDVVPATTPSIPLPENPPSPPPPVPTRYYTNFLGLFDNDGETPIAATAAPRLTDLVPPVDVDADDEPATDSELPSALPRAIVEDLDYVGGWNEDEDGHMEYVQRGHIEEVADDSNSAVIADPSRFLDAMSLPASATPPPRPSQRTQRELSLSPMVTGNSRFQHPRIADLTRNLTRFAASPLSQSFSLHGFPPPTSPPNTNPNTTTNPTDDIHILQTSPPNANGHFGSDSDDYDPDRPDPLADSLASLRPLRGLPQSTPRADYAIPEEAEFEEVLVPMRIQPFALAEPAPSYIRSSEPLADSLATSSLPQLPQPPPRRVSPPPPLPEPQPVQVREVPSAPMQPLLPAQRDILSAVPLHRDLSTFEGADDSIIDQNISSIEGVTSVVEAIRKDISAFWHLRNVQPHLDMCQQITDSLSRVHQMLMRRRALPQEHWSHLSTSSRSRYESRLLSLQRCLRRLADMSKRLLEPRKLDVLLTKLGQHYNKLSNVADKLDDTFDRLKLRHLYTVASKLTEEANRNRSTYMSAREMYLSKKSSRNKLRTKNSKRSLKPTSGLRRRPSFARAGLY